MKAFLEKISERLIYLNKHGMSIIGSSAGAMVMAAWIRYRSWERGLEIVPDVAVMPHHDEYDPNQIMLQFTETIPERTTVTIFSAGSNDNDHYFE